VTAIGGDPGIRNPAAFEHVERDRVLTFHLRNQANRSIAAIVTFPNLQVGRITLPDPETYGLTIRTLRREREQDSSKKIADFAGE
jgi:hypothetical protein